MLTALSSNGRFNLKSASSKPICTPLYKADCTDFGENKCTLPKPQPGMAIFTIMPTFFCCLFTANYWRKVEVEARQKVLTFPLVLMQLYLPFSDLRFAYQLLQNDYRVIAAKKNYDTTMSTIGISPQKITIKSLYQLTQFPLLFFQRLLLRPYPNFLC